MSLFADDYVSLWNLSMVVLSAQARLRLPVRRVGGYRAPLVAVRNMSFLYSSAPFQPPTSIYPTVHCYFFRSLPYLPIP